VQTGDVKEADLWLAQYTQTYNDRGLAQSKLWPVGTLCITIAANIAETAILRISACFPDSVVGFIPHPGKADVRFIKYFIDTIKLRMQNVSKGTTQDNLSLDKLLAFDFDVPEFPLQERIASTLSAYDDSIENNTRRIRTLEEMAHLLYREWFVNFRFPGHAKVRMVESESGPIPEGWDSTTLGNVLTLEYGKALKEADRRGGPIPVYGSSGVVGHHSEKLTSGRGIIVGRKGNVGSVFFCHSDFWVIDTAYYVRSDLSLYFLYFNLLMQNFLNNDAAVPGLNRNQAHSLPVVVPDSKALMGFGRIVAPMFDLKRCLEARNTNLRQTRDLLLPKLISGEIPVDNPRPCDAHPSTLVKQNG
jgi:type I restriction enzyme S subunit